MKSFLGFLLIPAAILVGFVAARLAPVNATAVFLPAVQSLKVPLSPDALSPVSRRDPAAIDFRSLMPLNHSPVQQQVVMAGPAPFIVSAIFVDGERRVTQIGTETYPAGDRIADYRIQRIEPMRVLLVANSGRQLWIEITKGY